MIDEKQFEKLIQNYKVISFDIFDTLLVRPFIRPTDIFKYIEDEYCVQGFAEERVLAEKRARRNIGKNEVTLNDIYSCINDKFYSFKNIELETEEKFLNKNILISNFFETVKKYNLKIICISDMYLSSSFLKRILEKNGFTGISEIFVSCEYNKTKFDGDIFKYVMYYLGINSSEILHIGDNLYSDYKIPNLLGIYSIKIPKLIELFDNRFGSGVLDGNYSLGFSAYVGLVAQSILKYKGNGYWFNMGYGLGGSIALSYTRYAFNVARTNNIEKLLFVARDGYILNKIFIKFFKKFGIDSEYVYLSRSVVKHEGNNLKKYLKSKVGKANKIGIVDLTTSGFSAVKAIIKYIPKVKVIGIYSVTLNDFSPVPFFRFKKTNFLEDYHQISEIAIELSEFLLSSPESPIILIDDCGKPKYYNNKGYREKIYDFIAKGIMQYSIDFQRVFSKSEYIPDITFDDWIYIAEKFSKNNGEYDKLNLTKVLKAKSDDNISDAVPFSEIIFK